VSEAEDVLRVGGSKKPNLVGSDLPQVSWCHLYELPIEDHVSLVAAIYTQDETLLSIFSDLAHSESQFAAIPDIARRLNAYLASLDDEIAPELEAEMLALFPLVNAISRSIYNSMRCVLFHGCFLNELVQRANSSDKDLFDAVRIDPTVVGCKSVIARISKATLAQDVNFFAKLKTALSGKMKRREQANFKKMRLVLEIMHEVGAPRLSDEQLQTLFVEELKLYAGYAKGAGNVRALRKFAEAYMKKNTTT
jgi:hypothetical protein